MDPYFNYPAPEYYPRHHFNQYPVDESLFPQTPFAVNDYVNNRIVDLESALSRLNIYSTPPSLGEPREHLLNEIIRNALILAEDPSGNCIVTYLLGLKTGHLTSNIIRNLEGNFFTLSCNKYGGTYVVQRCLTDSAEEQSSAIIVELLGNQNIATILTDPFGNYVFQSALAVSKGRVLESLVELVEQHSMSMRGNRFSKKILSLCKKIKKKISSSSIQE